MRLTFYPLAQIFCLLVALLPFGCAQAKERSTATTTAIPKKKSPQLSWFTRARRQTKKFFYDHLSHIIAGIWVLITVFIVVTAGMKLYLKWYPKS